MSKVGVIGAVVIVVGAVGGGGYYYLSNQAGKQLQNTVSLIEQSVPGSSIKYENYSVNPFSQSITLHKVVAKDSKGQEYTADTLVINGLSDDKLASKYKIVSISIDKFHTIRNGGTIDITHADAKNIVAGKDAIVIEDGKIKNIFPSKLSFDLLNIQNFSAIGPEKTGVTVEQYQIQNYGLKQKSNQTIKQVAFRINEDGKQYLKLNQAQIDGLDVAQISALIEQGQAPKANPGEPTKAIIEGMSANYSDQIWSIAKFETENSAAENGNFKRSAVFSGLKINTAHNAKLYPVKQIGYDELDVSGNIVGSYDKAKQQWSITPFTLNVKDMGNLDATLKFNAPGDLVNVNPQELATNYKLISFKVTLKNEGLLQKVFASQAKKQNISVDQVKQNTIKEIQQDADTAVIPVQKQGDEALLGLINDPTKSLVIEMNPVTPVATMDLLSKSQIEIFDTLKLSVKADAAK